MLAQRAPLLRLFLLPPVVCLVMPPQRVLRTRILWRNHRLARQRTPPHRAGFHSAARARARGSRLVHLGLRSHSRGDSVFVCMVGYLCCDIQTVDRPLMNLGPIQKRSCYLFFMRQLQRTTFLDLNHSHASPPSSKECPCCFLHKAIPASSIRRHPYNS